MCALKNLFLTEDTSAQKKPRCPLCLLHCPATTHALLLVSFVRRVCHALLSFFLSLPDDKHNLVMWAWTCVSPRVTLASVTPFASFFMIVASKPSRPQDVDSLRHVVSSFVR